MKRPQIVTFLTILLSLFYGGLGLYAQSGKTPPPPEAPTRTVGLPVDSNIWILLAIGVIIGVFILFKKEKINVSNTEK